MLMAAGPPACRIRVRLGSTLGARARGPWQSTCARRHVISAPPAPREQIDPAARGGAPSPPARRGRAVSGAGQGARHGLGAQISHWDRSAVEPDRRGTARRRRRRRTWPSSGAASPGCRPRCTARSRGSTAWCWRPERIGHGGSGRNVGLVNAGVWHPPAAVRKAWADLWAALRRALRRARRRRVRPDRETPDPLRADPERHDPRRPWALGVQGLQGRHAEWTRLGAPVEMLDARRRCALIGTRRFARRPAGHRAGTINPMGYVRGLARAARGAGARIAWACGSGADAGRRRLARRDEPGLAPGAQRGAGDERLYRRPVAGAGVGSSRSSTISSSPPSPWASREAILPGRQGLWDTAPIMTSLRKDRPGAC
jgi:hypothetical protein